MELHYEGKNLEYLIRIEKRIDQSGEKNLS